MRALVVYDSFFGNTEQVAQAIAQALRSPEPIRAIRVGEVRPEQMTGLKLLIVGSPTRGFRPSESVTNFLNAIPAQGLQGVKVAAFDTRLSLSDIKSSPLRLLVKTGGYAAKTIAGRLKKKGGEMVIPSEGFLVIGEKGPLKEGELERAADWARQIGETGNLAARSH
jgi:flavodoxin